jgi:murein DD-endopeptidase MepM/ murein hydrolase activator NlpD
LEPGSYTGQVGATEGFTVWTNNDCSGQDVQVGSTQWSSSNTGVATVSLVNGAGNVSCIAPGSATISAFVRLEEGGTWPKCTLQGFNPGAGVLVETPIQHNYPNRPFSNACRISQFFDHIGANGKKHDAQDVVLDNGKGAGSTPALGTPVYAVESGKVVVVVSGNGPASQPFPQCQGVGSAGNYVKVQNTTDKYFTVYFHVKPIVTVGQTVTVGQEIGTIDNSGCQSGPHLHVARKDPNGNPVNFTLPCVNPTPTNNFWDGLVDDDVPDTI